MREIGQRTVSILAGTYHGLIDDSIGYFQKAGKPIPPDNNRNYYVKGCWVLSQFQKMKQENPGHEAIKEIVGTLKDALPILRKAL